MMRVADYIMHCLVDVGIGHVFQVTGRGALFLNDALAKHTELEAVSLHHEQSCAFAAVAYAQQTDGLGACLVSTGCATTNTLTGVLSAWQDGIPCIFISGQNTLSETSRHTGIPLRTYGQQEADIVALVQPIAKFARMITKPEEIVETMDLALSLANSGRKGPVWIDVPLDLQSSLIDPENLPKADTAPILIPRATTKSIANIVEALSEAKRPTILIGNGIKSSGAEEAFRSFVECWKIPVAYTASATDTYGNVNLLSIGSVGSMGCSRAGNFTVQNADLLLVLGSRLSSLSTGPDFCKFAREAKIIVVDIDEVEHSKESIDIDQFIHSDLSYFLDQINQFDPQPVDPSWSSKCQHWKSLFSNVESDFHSEERVDLYQLAASLSDVLPVPSTVVTDSGLAEVILPTNIRFARGMNCIHPASQGAMGYALPASIGAYYGKDQPIVAIIGDGSIMMNLQELEVIRYRKLPIKIIVINNNVYSIIRRRQRELFRKRTIGTDPDNGISCPDFSKVAACFDLDYFKIERLDELDHGLTDLLTRDKAVLCEIIGRVDQGYIEIGHARSKVDRCFTRRSLEDQSPFLDRDLFLSEMIVDPIDQ